MALGARARATAAGGLAAGTLGGLVPPESGAIHAPMPVTGELRLLRPAIPVLAVLLAVAAVVAGIPILYELVYALAALLVLSFLWTRTLVQSLSVSRALRTKWCVVGEAVAEEFTLRNFSRLPGLWVEIRDGSTIPGYEPGTVQMLGSLETRTWRTGARCERRGLYTLGPLRLMTGDPFGIFQGEVTYAATTSFVVYPPLVELPELPMPYGRMQGNARALLRSLEVTTDASGLRDHAPGDGLHRIHWLSSARTGELRSKEFSMEASSNLWVLLDLEQRVHVGSGLESTEEYAVNVAGALVHRALRDGKAVGLVAHGSTRIVVPPGKGTAHLWRIMEVLATVKADGPDPLDRVLVDVRPTLGRGLSVVAVTPSTDPAWVRELLAWGLRQMVPAAVLVDATSFADAGAVGTVVTREAPRAGLSARALAAQLGGSGVMAHVVRQGQEFVRVGGHTGPASTIDASAWRRA
ncbi:MAG: DUF58 domain-containing protein [Chloroflexota bacterium]